MLKILPAAVPFALAVASLFTFSGCATYNDKSAEMYTSWQAGNSLAAASEAARRADDAAGSRDELLWRLEQGAILSATGDLAGSIAAFDQAEAIVNAYEEQAKLQLGNRAAALLSNQAALPYRGRAYDKIMLNTYKALSHLLLNEPDKARVELNRALQRQRDAVAENSKRIEEATEAAKDARSGRLQGADGQPVSSYDVERAQRDPAFAYAANAALARVDSRILPYADYVNPFAVFLDGLFFSHRGADAADLERAVKSFERVMGMSPGSHIASDFAMAERMANGAPAEPVTYVIFATGSAPVREELRIDIPLFLVSSTSYIGAAFPQLYFQDDYLPDITAITSDGAAYTSELLCSMDSVISKDFRNEWPSVVVNTLLTTATKAIAGKALEDAAGDDPAVQLLAMVVNIGWQAGTNRADLRTWTTLPKQFCYLRLPTPADGALKLTAGYFNEPITVEPGKTNIVLVRSVNGRAQLVIHQFSL